jgi:DNA processing protein
VAVLATPLGRVYPRHHRSLQRQVAQRGLLVTEQRAGAEVKRGNFAARNRLLVALAKAVVVVECPLASGALHGARLAWDAEIPLWAVPADTDRDSARGSNSLLQQGATPLLDPADLLASLGEAPLAASVGAPVPLAPGDSHPLLAALGQGASLEELGQRLQQPLPQLAQQLLELELAGLVQPAAGLCWRPRHNGFSPGALAG